MPDLNSDASYDRTCGRMMHRYCFVRLDFFRATVSELFRWRLTCLWPEFAPL